MQILSIPEPLLIYTGCRGEQQFAEGIVHLAFAYEHIEQLPQHKFELFSQWLIYISTPRLF